MLAPSPGAWASCSPTARAMEEQADEPSPPARAQKSIRGARLYSTRNGKSPRSLAVAGPEPRINPLLGSVIISPIVRCPADREGFRYFPPLGCHSASVAPVGSVITLIVPY